MKFRKKEIQNYTIHETKTHLSKLLTFVEEGEEIVIRRGSEPIAKIIPFRAPEFQRKAGMFKGEITLSDDFNASIDPDDFVEGKF